MMAIPPVVVAHPIVMKFVWSIASGVLSQLASLGTRRLADGSAAAPAGRVSGTLRGQTDEAIRLQRSIHDLRLQEETHRQKLQAEIVRLQADLSLQNNIAEDLHRRFEDASPFALPIGSVWRMLFREYVERDAPLLLIAPFWDETAQNATNDAGGSQFRVAVADALRDSPWGEGFHILDGYFKRPLRQTDMDVRIINDALGGMPVAVVYGTLDQHEIRAEIALWNVLPGEPSGRRVYIRGKGRLPREIVLRDNRAFRDGLGRDLAHVVGQVQAIHRLFRTGEPPDADAFRTGDAERDEEMEARLNGYALLHRAMYLEAPTPAAPAGRTRPDWASDWGQDGHGEYAAFTIGGVTQRLRWCPPGRFMMGSPSGEAGRYEDEGPRHEVTLAKGFWLFDTPCTQALWQAVMGGNPSNFKSPTRPVENVSFEDVQAFMTRANALVPGLNLLLPSEAQWEYACRAGTSTATYAGDLTILGEHNAPVLDAIAWYGGNCGVGFELANGYDSSGWAAKQYAHGRAGTRPVGLKVANPWGLHDMLGNVWEWCADSWHDNYNGAPTDGSAWTAGGAAARVFRGGSWSNGFARRVLAAYRSRIAPAFRSSNLGFRCARVQ